MGPFGSLTEAVLGDLGATLEDTSSYGFGNIGNGTFGSNINFAGGGSSVSDNSLPLALAIGALAVVLLLRK